MASRNLSLNLHDADHTAGLARTLGRVLKPGDTILLTGNVGAGKTHFARALILSLLSHPEDIPSPTFTLVQTYESTRGMIWHADLYRLSSSYEVEELGLSDAFHDAICLVEWPDRLGSLSPDHALELAIEATGDETREITASWTNKKWSKKLDGWAP
jgi:tRNA threonylcarbamoyladenosine biosynthesis protein TsaE